MEYNPIETWLDNVSISHSNSHSTRRGYKFHFQLFCNFIGKTPKQILEDYENSTDRQFKRKYAQCVRAFASAQFQRESAPNTINLTIAIVKSFFKYNDLPLGHVPIAQRRVLYHNRDITKDEVNLILDASSPREKAFYTIMAQSGLRPLTTCSLKFKHIKKDFEKNLLPCKIEIPQEIAKGKHHSYFTFIGEEAVKYLRAYLNTTPTIKDEDYLFQKQGTIKKTDPKSFAGLFRRTIEKLKAKGLMEVKQKKKGKPRDIRLYNLRKFFRKHANQAGFEFVQFWMGHKVKAGVDDHYRPKDPEFHRQLYKEKAMPFLRLEKHTPTETEKTIAEFEERNKVLQSQMATLVIENKGYAETLQQLQTQYQELLRMMNEMRDTHQKQMAAVQKQLTEKKEK